MATCRLELRRALLKMRPLWTAASINSHWAPDHLAFYQLAGIAAQFLAMPWLPAG
jgi:hypothetical protein